MTGSGLNDRGSWTPAFAGQRPPFEQGNTLAVTHGAYAKLALTPRANELADDLRSRAPLPTTPADDPGFAAFGMVGAQLEAAAKALESAAPEEHGRLRSEVRAWLGTYLRYAEQFGMTPAARVKLGLDLVRTGEALNEHLKANYQEGTA